MRLQKTTKKKKVEIPKHLCHVDVIVPLDAGEQLRKGLRKPVPALESQIPHEFFVLFTHGVQGVLFDQGSQLCQFAVGLSKG